MLFLRRFDLAGGGPDRDQRLAIARRGHSGNQSDFLHAQHANYVCCSYRFAAFAKRSGRPQHIAVAYSKFALNWGVFGLHRIARGYCRNVLKLVGSLPHDVEWARAIAHVGTAHYFEGRLDDGEQLLRQSSETLEKVSDYYAIFAHHWLRHIAGVRGDIPGEIAQAEAEVRLATERGNDEALAWGLYGKANALARAGHTEEALELATEALEIVRRQQSLTQLVAGLVLGFVRIQASDYAGACTILEKTAWSIMTSVYQTEFVAQAYPLLVESRLGPQWARRDHGPDLPTSRAAWRLSYLARYFGWTFPNYGSHALRVSGRAAYALGKTKKATKYFERAIVAAEKQGARFDLARALLDASLVIPEKADEYHRRGQQLLDELGAVVPEAERLDAPQ